MTPWLPRTAPGTAGRLIAPVPVLLAALVLSGGAASAQPQPHPQPPGPSPSASAPGTPVPMPSATATRAAPSTAPARPPAPEHPVHASPPAPAAPVLLQAASPAAPPSHHEPSGEDDEDEGRRPGRAHRHEGGVKDGDRRPPWQDGEGRRDASSPGTPTAASRSPGASAAPLASASARPSAPRQPGGTAAGPVLEMLPLGSGLVLIGLGLGLAFIALRVRRT
ncbi:hypothetical protein ACIGZH_04550 [Streptomyces sp. NPDC058319]|uniref:hypothetical protein n=1 Tax=unclassified Streptomyces TaxID=2593676 RepID=UPI0036E9A996